MSCQRCGGEHSTMACPDLEELPTPPKGARSGISSGPSPTKLHELIKLHTSLVEDNPYCYFELAYTRQTMWMAWLCSKPREDDPQRKVLACGQGATPEIAAEEALKSYKPGSEIPFKVESCWTNEKPKQPGVYWMRRKKAGVMLVYIAASGEVWDAQEYRGAPLDTTQMGDIEWAPVLPP